MLSSSGSSVASLGSLTATNWGSRKTYLGSDGTFDIDLDIVLIGEERDFALFGCIHIGLVLRLRLEETVFESLLSLLLQHLQIDLH